MELIEQFGAIDIYLFDQLLKGRITKDMRILDAGCGSGRNLPYFLRNGYNIYAVDRSAEAIQAVQKLGSELAPDWSADQARVETVEQMSFEADSFDFVISSAVLHFAQHEEHFQQMLHELWRVLKPGGVLFVRLASSIGIESQVEPLGNGRYHLPDGSDRFLVTEEMMMRITDELGGNLIEPLKTVQVAGLRSMSTWVLQKGSLPSPK
ncbi:class I SAM-dependent methyltransferase [Brevibacillus fluminis]|uniref:Class I SAM-dependent methyltransferase n=1 Tax=Brevibacillus fluminis TaxID=511487 RepID=A0A3M8D7V6_9BACL|nr:class I SAM-dependent methyltransferase [Brevibacillus fluminis]RNB83457.1 class I SAM-dependent methyltransferase [Brevibacillus fluminis]